ncbi:MAG TPA: YfiR family protein [Blastocatellia bacterium]|nr:YfiR family protein [Blastocatellia bacterium]
MNASTPIETTSANRPRPFPILTLICSAVLIAACGSVQLQAQSIDEYQVKIAFLYNFAKFVEWPIETFVTNKGSLTVGVVGEDPFGKTIDQFMNGKTVNGRQVTIKRLKLGQNLKDCHILFISSSEQRRVPQIVESLKGTSVLTISELQQFTQQGGMINLILDDDKIRFEVNLNAAAQAHLRISSKLLALAKSVTGEHNQGRN